MEEEGFEKSPEENPIGQQETDQKIPNKPKEEPLENVVNPQYDRNVVWIEIAKIRVSNNRRPTNLEIVEELKPSIKKFGLLNPITISKDLKLIAGAHRKDACEQLGYTEIPAIILDVDDLEQELAELEENSIRAELSVLEKSSNLARRKEIYEELYPETRPGGDRQGNPKEDEEPKAQRFTKAEEKRTGESERTIQRLIKVGKGIVPEVRDSIRSLPISDSQKDLIELAALDKDNQIKVAAKLKENPELSVKDALGADAIPKKSTRKPSNKKTSKINHDNEAPKFFRLPDNLDDLLKRANAEPDSNFVFLITAPGFQPVGELPGNVYFATPLESTIETVVFDEGESESILVIRAQISQAALNAPEITESFMVFQEVQNGINAQNDDAQQTKEPENKLNGKEPNMSRIIAKELIRIKCEACDEEIVIPSTELIFEEVESIEREQGPERQYLGTVETKCPKCDDKDIAVEATVWEYPIGTISSSDISVEGGSVERELTLEIRSGSVQ